MKRLYPKIMLLVGGVFAVIAIATVAFFYVSGSRQIEREWLARAETRNRMAFEAVYASMNHGGGSEDSRQVLARMQEMSVFTRVRVVKGDSAVQQLGAEPGELPQDELERRALAGEEVGQVRRERGHRVVRYVTPLRVQPECQRCHQEPTGSIIGAISSDISLQEYESALRQRRDVMLLVLGGGLLSLGVLMFYALRRMVIRPLRTIERGTAAIAHGDLDHRLHVHTGDEFEILAQEFNRMARGLQESYGRVAEEQRKVLAAIEASQDAIWVSDANRRVVMVNSALEQHIGQRRDELLGQPCPNLLGLHNLDGPSICDAACPFLHPTLEGIRVEGCILSASGKEIWVEISYGSVTDLDGHLAGMIHIVRDLTQRREIEQLKEEFISTVSHELRTPLNHIKGFATTLLQTDVEWDAATQRDFLGSINREADRLTNLVDKILHLSRLEAEGLPMEREEYQVNDLVDGALQRRRSLMDGRKVDLCLAPDVPTLMVDGREIEVVLMNLIENAVKYSDPGTPITLSARRHTNEVVFSVHDQGLGIPAEHREHIFERFYRVDNGGRRAPGGTGLGLAICKRIVEAHDGHIWVESTPGVGSSFHFSLPVDGGDGRTVSSGLT